MAILCDANTKLLVQGMGRMGRFHAGLSIEYGTQVVGGVAPGKGGQVLDDIPVFDTVRQAVAETGANASVIFVPPPGAADAIVEAADAGLALAACITEGIPTLDMARAKAVLRGSPLRLVGPNCPGVVTPEQCRIGIMPAAITRPGPRWTRSTWRAPRATIARRMCCAPIPRRCRSARWRPKARPFASSHRAACTARIMT